MCGIVGFHSKNVTKEHLMVLQNVMKESRIRGMHGSGIAWYNGDKIMSDVRPVPIDQLTDSFDFSSLLYDNDEVCMIAHARYSTSDIRYNQPLVGDKIAIAMNGVISQEEPSTWEKTYGYKCWTKNDSELMLCALESGDNVFTKFNDASFSIVAIDNTGKFMYFRNGQRPMWFGKLGEGTIYASTYDILNRAGVEGITKVNPSDYKELQRRSKRP